MKRTIASMLLAYRQTKQALCEERQGLGREEIAQFEMRLEKNLRAVQRKLRHGDFDDLSLGGVWVTPKKVATKQPSQASRVVRIAEQKKAQALHVLDVRFQLQPSIEFAIGEVLWIWQYGPAIERLLIPECLANRLNLDTSGNADKWKRDLFKFWPQRYRAFQEEAVAAARRSLQESEICTFAMFDIRSYYDRIDPNFLLSREFVQRLMRHTEAFDEKGYRLATRSLLAKFSEFRRRVAAVAGQPAGELGIPIGAISSRLIANVALAGLDRAVPKNRKVRYYSRWVDDVIVVLDGDSSGGGMKALAAELLPLTAPGPGETSVILSNQKLECGASHFEIHPDKARIYLLEGEAGRDFLNVIRADLGRLVSAKNAFAELKGNQDILALASARSGDGPEAFHGMDELRVRRFATSVLISKATEAIGLLPPDASSASSIGPLRALLRVIGREADRTSFLDLVFRILAVAVAAGRTKLREEAIRLLHRWSLEIEQAPAGAHWNGLQLPDRASRLVSKFIHARVVETIATALPTEHPVDTSLADSLVVGSKRTSATRLLRLARSLQRSDLRLLDRQMDATRGALTVKTRVSKTLVIALTKSSSELGRRLAAINRFLKVSREGKDPVYVGVSALAMFLMLRPPSIFGIGWLWAQGKPTEPVVPMDVINAIRSTNYQGAIAEWEGRSSGRAGTYKFPQPLDVFDPPTPVRIVLGNLRTKNDWFAAALDGPASPVPEQLERLAGLASVVAAARRLRRSDELMLLLLPELSVPRRWIEKLAMSLVRDQIALVAGLEYLRDDSERTVVNEVIGVIPGAYFRAGVAIWRKVLPAVGEETQQLKERELRFPSSALHSAGGRVVSSRYGDFSVLICSELLEIAARSRLPGRVDYVLVPSWNPDRQTFEHLAQASALDLHAFVAIANNALYSDCRIRGPYKLDYKKDVCRLIDPGIDSVISGVPEIAALRRHHKITPIETGATPIKPDPEFKPLPPGFKARRPKPLVW